MHRERTLLQAFVLRCRSLRWQREFPEAFAQFEEVCKTLETHYRDMQDMEFTVENEEAVHAADP